MSDSKFLALCWALCAGVRLSIGHCQAGDATCAAKAQETILLNADSHSSSSHSPRRVTFISVNDVYKLVGLPTDLKYFYLKEDFDYVNHVGATSCDGRTCGDDIEKCGSGSSWEACFPLSFDRVQFLSLKEDSGSRGVRVASGPCGSDVKSSLGANKYGGMIDFAATYKWLKEEAAAEGDLVIGTFPGDFIAPSYLAEIFQGKQLVEIMNHMGVDLVNIGNHDVDFKLTTLRNQMGKSAFHYLNANLMDLLDPDAPIQQPMVSNVTIDGNDFSHQASEWRQLHKSPGSQFGDGWAILVKGVVKVCVLGNTDTDKMNWKGKKIKAISRDIPAALEILRMWERDRVGCTLRIAMTHTRTGNDLNLFRAVELAGFHLDAIIAGHDHYVAFAELNRTDGGVTHVIMAGADARIVLKLSFDVSGERPFGSLEVVPVVTDSCKNFAHEDRLEWFKGAQTLFKKYAHEAEIADSIPLNIFYKGVYDTNFVRDGETLAVNMWLDVMRESLSGDVLFFQAGLVRQDMYQDFGSKGMNLSRLFMLEEFPWGDADLDARSSVFPFHVSVKDIVEKTLPWLARSFWCKAPFNDANRIHMSGIVIEMVNDVDCDTVGRNPIKTISYVGNCHKGGSLRDLTTGCCTSEVCGRLWTDGAWDLRVSPEIRSFELTVLTGQFCVPSKYGSHGPGFHDVGVVCSGAEHESNWGSGASFASQFQGRGVLGVDARYAQHASTPFSKLGYAFKQSVEAMLTSTGRSGAEVVGPGSAADCHAGARWYDARSFIDHCLCEVGAQTCSKPPTSLEFPRFFAASPTEPRAKL